MMRLHTDLIQFTDIYKAAELARVGVDWTPHGSRSHVRAFEVKLTGESRRRPNSGNYGAGQDDYAATWDQWGVFLAALYEVDRTMSCWAYNSRSQFHIRTADRFREGWPSDAHGDHTFRFGSCTKCSAQQVRDYA